jgi:hypothetical protein
MRSGPIEAEDVEERVDRRNQVLPLWERGNAAAVDLPWGDAANIRVDDVRAWLAGATTVVLVVGATKASRALLDAVLAAAIAPCRLYIYGDQALESDAALVRAIASASGHVLARLGHRPPADWLVVDGGRQGQLVLGRTSAHRRWIVPADGPLARSLYEAFRVLFWFHSTREALPDARGNLSFRAPLPAPFESPGPDVALPSGRLRLAGDLEDPVPDAEFRVSPSPLDPGRARVVFVPPSEALADGGEGGPVALDLPRSLVDRGHGVVWTYLGLPKTSITRQRVVLDLVESPIALQLEWPRDAAIALFHRFERLAKQPEWLFHVGRRLREIGGPVLLEGASKPDKPVPTTSLDAGDVEAPLLDFDSARPPRLPDVSPLCLEANYKWRRVPAALPPGAQPAALTRGWIALDEWSSRKVDTLRGALSDLDDQEGLLSRLLRWLPARDAAAIERRKLRDEIDDLGESPPSQAPESVQSRLDGLARAGDRVKALQRATHADRQTAEEAEAKEKQRADWEQRVAAASASLADAGTRLATNGEEQREAIDAQRAAQLKVDERVAGLRAERLVPIDAEIAKLQAEVDAAQTQSDSIKKAPKGQRQQAAPPLHQLRQALERKTKERAGVATWSPPESLLGDDFARLSDAKKATSALQTDAKSLSAEIKALEAAASESFRFAAPPRHDLRPASDSGPPPQVPAEAPPELGDLYELRGERFLAIRTWEQLKPATPVATRLRAKLVVASTLSKR